MDKILVSACLLGAQVRYDGGHCLLDNPTIARWKHEGRLISVCPEVLGGLPTPRPPAEIQNRFPILVTTSEGRDFTPQFVAGAELAIDIAREHDCCCALLKARSPSCGNRTTYDGNFTGTETNAPGVTADELIRAGIPVFNEEEIEALIEFIESRTSGPSLPSESNEFADYRYGSTCG